MTSVDGRKYYVEAKNGDGDEELNGGKKGGKGGGARGKGDQETTWRWADRLYKEDDEQASPFIKSFLLKGWDREMIFRSYDAKQVGR